MTTNFAIVCGVLAIVWLSPAAAQQQDRRPHPADPAATAPALRHPSAFEGYRRLGDDQRSGWREANDEVARAGGHIGILKAAPAGSGNSGSHAGHQPGVPK